MNSTIYHSFVCFTQVYHWMHRVDRSLCERLRAFQSPPPMAGMVMVMVMVLLGRPEFAAGIEERGPATLHPPDTSARESRALPWEQDLMRHLAPALQHIREEVPIMHIIRDHLRLLFWVRPG